MGLGRSLETTARLLWAGVRGRPFPLVVNWNVTYRCNLKCGYCGVCGNETEEMDTRESLYRLDELADLGSRFLGISGGEPLMRADVGDLVRAARDRGLSVSMQTNGTLVRERLDDVRSLNDLQVSLDGPRRVHDAVRGDGVFNRAVEAVEVCRGEGLPVALTAVITRASVGHLDDLLDLAERLGVGVWFQPTDAVLGREPGRSAQWAPSGGEYRQAVDDLLGWKKSGRPSVLNSLSGLRHIRAWPEVPSIACSAGRFMCSLEPDGRVSVCDMSPKYMESLQSVKRGMGRSLEQASLPRECGRCLTGSMVDLNLAAAGRPDAMLSVVKKVINIP